MKRGIWVHQFSQLGEQTVGDIAATLVPRGITEVYIKSHDGDAWMANFYNHPLAPADGEQLAALCMEFAANGLDLIPWVVPRFNASEADAHRDAADACKSRLIVDWEYHYAGFWQGTAFEASRYWSSMRAMANGGYGIGCAPDPRQVGRDYGTDLISGVQAYLPQTYWTDFQRDALVVLEDAWSSMAGLGSFEPIFPWNATAADMEAAIGWAYGKGCSTISLWRMGLPDAAALDRFAERAPGEDVEPTPEPTPVENCDKYISALAYVCDDLGDKVDAESHKKTPSKLALRAIVAEMRRVREQTIGPRP